MLVGAGSAGSSVDAANILKPFLSSGAEVISVTPANLRKQLAENESVLERFDTETVSRAIDPVYQALVGLVALCTFMVLFSRRARVE